MNYTCLHELPADFVKEGIYLAVVGSRTITDYNVVKAAIANYRRSLGFLSATKLTLVSGGARGVDTLAEHYAEVNGLDIIIIEADWDWYGTKAGMLRNTNIIRVADHVIAIQKDESSGTQDGINKARAMKKPVTVIEV